MDAETKIQLQQHIRAIGAILYAEAAPQTLTTFEGIDRSIRSLAQAHVLHGEGVPVAGTGRGGETIFDQHKVCHSEGFRAYLKKHLRRSPNYEADQQAGETIGSGRVESLVKQIAARVKLSGAQWARQTVPRVLHLRCAYLNGAFAA